MTRVRDLEGSPSWLDSWLLWRKFSTMGLGVQKLFDRYGYRFPQPFYKLLRAMDREICPFCEGWGEISDPNYGKAYCLCAVLSWAYELDAKVRPFRSYAEQASLSDLRIDRGLPVQRENLMLTVDKVDLWMKWPNAWLSLSGPTGCGKTTILRAINREFWPIALYVTAYDFEKQMYRGQDDGTFNTYIDLLSMVPILLFDDWGAEYGKPLVHSKLLAVMKSRDAVWRELLTIVATNLPQSEFKDYNMRMGSILLDPEKVVALPMIAPDHRLPERK